MAIGTTNFPTSLDTADELVRATNNATTKLTSGINNSVTSIGVSSVALFPSSGIIRINEEIISYTGTSGGNTFTGCSRGFEGTTATSHQNNDNVTLDITAASNNVKNDAIIAIETKIGTGASTPTANTVMRGTGTGTSAYGQIVNGDVSASAAIAHSKLANMTAGTVMIGNASNVPTATAITGDVTVTNAGVTAIASGAIVNADINASADISYSKLASVSSTDKILGRASAGSGPIEEITCTAAGRALIDDATAVDQRITLGLGTIATQSESNVSITGGTVTGITDLTVSDGGTGLSTLTANNLLVGNGSNPINFIAPGANGNVLTSNGTVWTSAAPNSNIQQGLGVMYKNRIINGNMAIDQRNAGASITPIDGSFCVDRWKFGLTQSSKFTAQQSTVAPTGFINSLLITSSSAYSVTSTDEFEVWQPIEGLNISDLAWGTANAKTVTLSFWTRSSLTGTFGGIIRNNAGNRVYPFTYTINSANTFEYKTITIVGDTTGTWLTTNGIGMYVWFSFGAGSSKLSTAGAWTTGGAGATGQTNLVGTNGATWYLTGVQLEVGTQATAFSTAGGSYGAELALCQRYYQRQFPFRGVGVAIGNTVGRAKSPTIVSMRASPTATISGTLYLYDGSTIYTSTVISQAWCTPDLFECNLTIANGNSYTSGKCIVIYNDSADNTGTLSTGGIILSAEF